MSVEDQVATEQSLSGAPCGGPIVGLFLFQGPRRGGVDELCQRDEVGASQGPSRGRAQGIRKRLSERDISHRFQASDRIAAAFALGCGRRLEGDRRLRRIEADHSGGTGIDRCTELHLMDDPHSLQLATDGAEAALAQIENRSVRRHAAIGLLRDDDAQGARVDGMAGNAQLHGVSYHEAGRVNLIGPICRIGPISRSSVASRLELCTADSVVAGMVCRLGSLRSSPLASWG
jgi:hypothetical protein